MRRDSGDGRIACQERSSVRSFPGFPFRGVGARDGEIVKNRAVVRSEGRGIQGDRSRGESRSPSSVSSAA